MNRNDVGVHFGLGRTTRVKSAWKIRWPSGLVETLTDLEVDRVHVVEEGDGEPQSARVVPARAVYVR